MFSGHSFGQDEKNQPLQIISELKTSLSCGPNSLFIFLILSGRRNVSREQLESIPISSSGSSLLDLQRAAKQFNCNVNIRKVEAEEVDLINLPAIGQFRTGPSVSSDPLHFNVIYKVDTDRIYLLDGTTGFKFYIKRAKLQNLWTGFVLSEKKDFLTSIGAAGWQVLLICIIIVIEYSAFYKLYHYMNYNKARCGLI